MRSARFRALKQYSQYYTLNKACCNNGQSPLQGIKAFDLIKPGPLIFFSFFILLYPFSLL